MEEKPVLILGSGLAGLACALTLKKAGRRVRVLERSVVPGGRVATQRDSRGFLFDQGFQVLLDSYPEVRTFLDLETLELGRFHSGALIFTGDQTSRIANPIRHPETLLSGIFVHEVSVADKLRVLSLIASSRSRKSDQFGAGPTTLELLRDAGFESSFIENFWRPFLSGVFLDPELSLNSDFFLFLVRCFSSGSACLPAQGMAAIPAQMATALSPDELLLGTTAARWNAHSVELESGERLEGSAVVCAHDPRLRSGGEASFRSVRTVYFTGPKLAELDWGKWLVLVPRRLGLSINHLALLSAVSPSYAPEGKPLLSVNVLGRGPLDLPLIAREVEQVAGRPLSLEHLHTVEVPMALPRMTEPPEGFSVREGIYYCGDQWASPSINGALRSGRLAAERILEDS